MQIIRTDQIDYEAIDGWEKDQVYNGLDVAITADVLGAISQLLDPITRRTYEFSRALQGPVLDMRIRGCLIDQARKMEVIDELWEVMETLEYDLNRVVFEGVGMPMFNWRSPKDLRELFYTELNLPVVRRGGAPSCDRGARERLEVYPVATVLVRLINGLAELGNKISVLRTDIDADGRIRTSYNIAGTSTGRFSSSLSEFGTGGNLQNVEESLRSILIADNGFKFAKFDAKSGESFIVGAIEWNLFRDPRFLDACQSGDVHTAVAKAVWPRLAWTGDISRDKDVAERPYYRDFSYRFMCKKIGHGSNYLGGAREISDQTRIPIPEIERFQKQYFETFPAHRQWHAHVEYELRTVGRLTSLMGRRRDFFKRRTEPKTLKEAVAYDPQSSLADIVNRGMLETWRLTYDPSHPIHTAKLMFQDHDATTWMYPEALEDTIVPIIQQSLTIHVELAEGRFLEIPYDCEVGWNKGKHSESKNPDGLKKYAGGDNRRRTPAVGILDRIVHKANRKRTHAGDLPKVGGDLTDSGGAGTESLVEDGEPAVSESICADSRPPWSGED